MKGERKNKGKLSKDELYDQIENVGLNHWLAFLNEAIPYSELVKESSKAVKAASERRHHKLIAEQIQIVRAKMGVEQLLEPKQLERIINDGGKREP